MIRLLLMLIMFDYRSILRNNIFGRSVNCALLTPGVMIYKEIIFQKMFHSFCYKEELMYDKHILREEGARSVWEHGKKTGYQFNLTINYYRGLPLCCIDEIAMQIDGENVDPAQMYLQHQGREYPYLDVLKDDFPTDFYWLFGEMLTVVVRNGCGIEQGVHHCRLKLGTRRSYTPTMVSYCEKDITFA